MKKMMLLIVLLLANYSQAAGIYSLDYYWPLELNKYFNSINSFQVQNSEKLKPSIAALKCNSLYRNALAKKNLEIRYALGYFDDSQGKEITHAGINHGLSPSLDRAVFHIIRQYLEKPCVANSPQLLCGFNESGDPESGMVVLEKEIELHGQSMPVRIKLTHASASDSYMNNKSSLQGRQSQLTAQSEENFFNSIGGADMSIYNGHSRNGGGPDFNPPRLNSQKKTDYKGFYEVQQPGLKRLLQSIKSGSSKDQLLALFSCYSQKHFLKEIQKVNSKQKLILSSDTIDYLDSLLASMGYLEGFLHGLCGQDLSDMVKQGAKQKDGFRSFNL